MHISVLSKNYHIHTLIIGGGHCGVNLGCWLEERLQKKQDNEGGSGHTYQILDDSIFPSYLIVEQSNQLLHQWKEHRWDDFQLNTQHGCSLLHGQPVDDEIDGVVIPSDSVGKNFSQQVKAWDRHIAKMNLRHCTNQRVVSIQQRTHHNDDDDDDDRHHQETNGHQKVVYRPHRRFLVTLETTRAGSDAPATTSTLTCTNVVVCTGQFAKPHIPNVAQDVPPSVRNLHSRDFKSPDQFPIDQGAVLVVGSGQSGAQIADLLADSGRKVLLCTSKMSGIGRTFRQEDIYHWFSRLGILGMTNEERLQRFPPERAQEIKYQKKAMLGADKSISYFSLHRKGVKILGGLDRLTVMDASVTSKTQNEKVSSSNVVLQLKSNRMENVKKSYESFQYFQNILRDWVAKQPADYQAGLGPDTQDPDWIPEVELLESDGPSELSFQGIQAIIWCTGYSADFSFLQDLPLALEHDFDPISLRPDRLSSSVIPGLYYSGFPWVHHIQSMNLVGFDRDHELLVNMMMQEERQADVKK